MRRCHLITLEYSHVFIENKKTSCVPSSVICNADRCWSKIFFRSLEYQFRWFHFLTRLRARYLWSRAIAMILKVDIKIISCLTMKIYRDERARVDNWCKFPNCDARQQNKLSTTCLRLVDSLTSCSAVSAIPAEIVNNSPHERMINDLPRQWNDLH